MDGVLFCILDQDNDGSKVKVCISEYYSGWWYLWNVFCIEVNFNGIYYLMYKLDKIGIFWFDYDEYRMML